MARSDPICDRKQSTSSSVISDSAQQDTDWCDRFTAAGRPMPPKQNLSGWSNACVYVTTAPDHPPFRFTDDSIIPVLIRVREPSKSAKATPRLRRSLRACFGAKEKTKVVMAMMPRRDYLRYFAHDEAGNYVGTEKEESWTESDLEEEFGEYKQERHRKWVVKESERGFYMEEE
ncbi:hypothetical protein VE00_04318 [Pseudogymnoascus sp. WSF 3629]|nr:hypothetical protein VE00_04318 [Pseudogymnoascus sp. WSF 3629]